MADLIDRQAAIEAITEYIEEYNGIDNDGLHDPKWCAMMEARTVIESLPSAEPRWIPVTERLPEESDEYFVTFTTANSKKAFITICECDVTYTYDYEHGRFEVNWLIDGKVTAWMPLPGPWKGEE